MVLCTHHDSTQHPNKLEHTCDSGMMLRTGSLLPLVTDSTAFATADRGLGAAFGTWFGKDLLPQMLLLLICCCRPKKEAMIDAGWRGCWCLVVEYGGAPSAPPSLPDMAQTGTSSSSKGLTAAPGAASTALNTNKPCCCMHTQVG